MQDNNKEIFNYLKMKFREYYEMYPKYDIFSEKHFRYAVEMFKDSMLDIVKIKEIIDEQLEKMAEEYKQIEKRNEEFCKSIQQPKSKEEIITELVTFFARLSNVSDENATKELINKLVILDNDEIIDYALLSLNERRNTGKLSLDDILSNTDLIKRLNPEKYKTNQDLIDRLNWIRTMNMEYPQTNLDENHKLIIEIFDKFNMLLQGRFDCYYTGGLMGYLATNQPLERYHGDLDLFINETQLEELKQLVDASEDFQFINNMEHKEVDGHEYKVTYKGMPVSIGLFMFERNSDSSITEKKYYYENKNVNGQLFVDENHFTKEYTDLTFSNQLMYHNGIPYKMKSLASIFNSKKAGRPKDVYDASKIKPYVNMLDDYRIDIAKSNNHVVKRKKIDMVTDGDQSSLSGRQKGLNKNHKKRNK